MPSRRGDRRRDRGQNRVREALSAAPGSEAGALPDHAAIVEALRVADGPMTLMDLTRVFGLRSADRRRLKDTLTALVGDGIVARVHHGDAYRLPARLPETAVLEVTRLGSGGDLFAKLADERLAPGAPLFRITGGLVAPSPGDRVLARLRAGGDGEWRAEIIRRVDSTPEFIVGVYEGTRQGGSIRPADRRIKDTPTVAAADRNGAEPGDLVRASLTRDRPLGAPRARIVERLGPAHGPRAASLIVIHQSGIPVEFSAEARAEAAAAKPATLAGRADLRALPLVTIDGADARDFDDAVFAEPDPDPANPGGWRLVVAIADVAHYVRPGSALDRAALERGNSVYFPDRVVPMLPEELSNDLCSLRPDEDRACLAAHLRIDAEGNMLGHRFERGLMRSVARLTYERAQQARDGDADAVPPDVAARIIAPLYGAYAALDAARLRRQTLEIDLPERKIELDAAGRVTRLYHPPRLDSHRLIEEFMILANVAAAEALEARRQPCMYRVHEPPDLAKLEALRPVLKELEIALPPTGVRPADFNRALAQARGTPSERLVNELVLRTQSQAVYSPQNLGHYGLALRRYAHFTSPIRRYADLLVHRALLGDGVPGGIGRREAGDWDAVGAAISKLERRAMAAERDTIDRYLAAFMADRVGAEFEGTVAGVARFGLFVTLPATGAEGLLPVSALPRDYYLHDAARHSLQGRASGRLFRLGDGVTIRLEEADAVTGSLLFSFVAHTPARHTADMGKRGGRPPRPVPRAKRQPKRRY